MPFIPYAVSWNITSRCNLSCDHCYLDAGGRESGGEAELSTEQALKLIGQIAEVNSGAVLILTGGEPMARPDLYDLCREASSKGLMVALGTNGTMLTKQKAEKLKEAGVTGVGISIDSLKPERHDSFRGLKGALKSSMDGLLAAKEAGIGIQVQTTPTKDNLDEIPLIAEWAHRMGARVFNLFFLVCTGRGETMTDITPDEYERVLKWAADEKDSFPGMMIRPKCAPHFKRILHQENPDNHLLKTYIAACRAGSQYCRVTPEGKVTPCPYMDNEAGVVTETNFGDIWRESEVLSRYRTADYNGKCGLCRYRLLCGGCRARALATTGDDMGEDQWCVYEPVGQEEAIENIDTQSKFGVENSESTVPWSPEAEQKLLKVPVFARAIVKLGVEKYAQENGAEIVTPELMTKAAPSPKMFDELTGKKDKEKSAEIPWDDDARARVENAPEFVRPGILKLMQKRAKERGQKKLSSEFLTEIRDESMMLATRRMKKLGFSELQMEAWEEARQKFSKSPEKQEVIDTISSFLDDRPKKNEKIMEKFASFFDDDVGEKIGWTKEARKRMESAPPFVRGMATKAVEKFAKENGYGYVTEEALDKAMEKMPFGNFK